MYWTSILYYLSWPAFIAISYFVVVFVLKKANMYADTSED